MPRDAEATRTKLLDAALRAIRTKGYAATSVDDLCREAGVTKGAFFHHFESKEQLAIEAAHAFAGGAERLFGGAPYRQLPDPVERLLGYVDFRIQILRGELPEFTCLLGTMVQEVYASNPALLETCAVHLGEHADDLAVDVEAAIQARRLSVPWTARSLASTMQALIQGAFILAKAEGGPAVAAECLDHLKRYLRCTFECPDDAPTSQGER